MEDVFQEILKGSPLTGNIQELPGQGSQKKLVMVFLVDTSYSMLGSRIDNVNQTFEDMLPKLRQLQSEVADSFEIQIAILTFGSNAQWLVPPTGVYDYVHTPLEVSGATNYGKMLRTLSEKLTRSGYMPDGKAVAPYIMLMTDGAPTDSGYEKVMEELEDNLWYRHAQRYAVLIGEEAINSQKARKAVQAFVKDPAEGILTAADALEISKTVTAQTIHTLHCMTMRGEPAQTPPDWTFPVMDTEQLTKKNIVF